MEKRLKNMYPMLIKSTPLNGCFVLQSEILKDDRGTFSEVFRQDVFEKVIGKIRFVQDNEVMSNKGVLRGMHYQESPYEQSKLIRVIQGSILDITIDLRPESSTYKQLFSVELTAKNYLQLFVPKGFAHGYLVLEDRTKVIYKVDQFYAPDSEKGISPLDPFFDFNWSMDRQNLLISERDLKWPAFQ